MVNEAFVVQELSRPCVYYDAHFLDDATAQALYDDLRHNIKWEKTVKINRWVSLFHELDGGDEVQYKYRDAPGAAHVGFNDSIRQVQLRAQEWYYQQTNKHVKFNVCLLNYYENGTQAIGWHADREEIGRSTPIASVSLGSPRSFCIRSKDDGMRDRAKIDLQHGSLVVMENVCQENYLHSVPRQSDVTAGRINLTFRCKEEGFTTAGEKQHGEHDNFMQNITQGAVPHSNTWYHSTTDKNGAGTNSHRGMFGDTVAVGDLPEAYPCLQFLAKTNIGAERFMGAEMQKF